ncbi:secD/SecF GG Motif family protein [Mycobacterium intracellulare 1956]|uniref:SecD/SecF GG Motif family protein n=1 Tax=Mycobacterium intracellulare 1956 TaxID=1299331 RepID=X8CGW8_MYCIT|nr:secD/SecF GG Motif family protein [Mycobacterium intracellulare 1956]
MASSSAPVHPARYLSVFLVLLIGVYLLVFLTGDKRAAPKLGIDLQGGTRVTLTARTPDGSRPSREALAQAQQIIGARVNGLGVSGSEVVVDGDNLIITVPGNDGNEARNLGQTARLYIRPVLNSMPAQSAEPKPPAHQPAPGQPAPAEPAPAEPGPAANPHRANRPRPGRTARAGRQAGRPAPPYPQDPPPAPTPAPPAPAPGARRPPRPPGPRGAAGRAARVAGSAQGPRRAHRRREEVAAEHPAGHPVPGPAVPGDALRQRRHPGRQRRSHPAADHLLDRPQGRVSAGALDHQR